MAAGSYVALGDSISIDDYSGGPGRGGPSLLFRNQDDDFPHWRGRDLASRGYSDLHLLATDGATIDTVLQHQLPYLVARGLRASVLTVTVGGNDLLQSYGDTRAARATIHAVANGLSTALAQLAPLVAADGRIVVGTVYDPSDGTGATDRLGLPPWPDAVRAISELNTALRHVAARHGAAVAEIGDVFWGHGLTAGDPRSSEARPADRDVWFCHVIEPNAWGADGVRTALWTALGLDTSASPTTCTG